MGKRSRKRPAGPVQPTASDRPVRTPVQSTSRRAAGQSRVDRFVERADERPKPPWHPVPLVELSVLVGIVLIVIGAIDNGSSRGRIALVFGLALASLGGLDTAAREHFNGFRSHSSLLAGLPAVATLVVLAIAGLPFAVYVGAGVLVFAAGFWVFRSAFRRRTGVGFKV